MVKLSISYLHKEVIPWLKSTKTIKTCPSMYYLIKTVLCINCLMPKLV